MNDLSSNLINGLLILFLTGGITSNYKGTVHLTVRQIMLIYAVYEALKLKI